MQKIAVLVSIIFSYSFCHSQNWDINTLRKINHNASETKTKFFHSVEKFSYVVDIGTPSTLIIAGLAQKDKTLISKGITGLGAYAQNALLTYILKKSINRARPFETYADIIQRNDATSRSMPSGHTSAAFTTATSLTLAVPKWCVAVPAYSFASLVGYSRMYEGVHYPSDVLVGAVVGTGTALLAYKLRKIIIEKQHKKGNLKTVQL